MDTGQQHVLGTEANAYVCEVLEYGHSLSRHLRRAHDLRQGRVVAWLPAGANTADLEKFEWGGKCGTDEGSGLLADYVKDFLEAGENRACVFENYLYRRRDFFAAEAKSRVLYYGDEVYHVVDGRGTGLDEIRAAIDEAKGPTISVGVLAVLPRGYRLLPTEGKDALTEDDLAALSVGARSIAVGAYDAEAYLVWEKP